MLILGGFSADVRVVLTTLTVTWQFYHVGPTLHPLSLHFSLSLISALSLFTHQSSSSLPPLSPSLPKLPSLPPVRRRPPLLLPRGGDGARAPTRDPLSSLEDAAAGGARGGCGGGARVRGASSRLRWGQRARRELGAAAARAVEAEPRQVRARATEAEESGGWGQRSKRRHRTMVALIMDAAAGVLSEQW